MSVLQVGPSENDIIVGYYKGRYLRDRTDSQRDVPHPDHDDIIDDYRNTATPAPANAPGVLPVHDDHPLVPGPYKRYKLDFDLKDKRQREFYEQPKPHLPGNPGRWRPKKMLGSGGFGIAGLWEYKPQSGDPDVPVKQIVIKEASPDNEEGPDESEDSEGKLPDNMINEARILSYLGLTNSQHVVRMIGPRHFIEEDDPSDDLRPFGGLKFVGRIYMEYCELGDLFGLGDYRAIVAKPFDELTLWKFFECFVDAVLLLETGNDTLKVSKRGRKRRNIRRAPRPVRAEEDTDEEDSDENDDVDAEGNSSWKPIVHFDLKPENIFLTKSDANHPHMPICKFGDFGGASFWPPFPDYYSMGPRSYGFEDGLRARGTVTRHPPEQLHESWDHHDRVEVGIAGVYGSKSDIFCVGTVMYSLITLKMSEGPEPLEPFRHTENISGVPSKCESFGFELSRFIDNPYSQMLIDTIWECMYLRPEHRPTVMELKQRVEDGIRISTQVAKQNGWRLFEPWKSFQKVKNLTDSTYNGPARRLRRRNQ